MSDRSVEAPRPGPVDSSTLAMLVASGVVVVASTVLGLHSRLLGELVLTEVEPAWYWLPAARPWVGDLPYLGPGRLTAWVLGVLGSLLVARSITAQGESAARRRWALGILVAGSGCALLGNLFANRPEHTWGGLSSLVTSPATPVAMTVGLVAATCIGAFVAWPHAWRCLARPSRWATVVAVATSLALGAPTVWDLRSRSYPPFILDLVPLEESFGQPVGDGVPSVEAPDGARWARRDVPGLTLTESDVWCVESERVAHWITRVELRLRLHRARDLRLFSKREEGRLVAVCVDGRALFWVQMWYSPFGHLSLEPLRLGRSDLDLRGLVDELTGEGPRPTPGANDG